MRGERRLNGRTQIEFEFLFERARRKGRVSPIELISGDQLVRALCQPQTTTTAASALSSTLFYFSILQSLDCIKLIPFQAVPSTKLPDDHHQFQLISSHEAVDTSLPANLGQ